MWLKLFQIKKQPARFLGLIVAQKNSFKKKSEPQLMDKKKNLHTPLRSASFVVVSPFPCLISSYQNTFYSGVNSYGIKIKQLAA